MCFRCSGDNSGVIPRGSGGGSSSGTEQNVSSKGESWGGNRGSACNGGPGPMANPGGFSIQGAADGTSRGSWALRSTKGLVCKDLVWNRGLGEGEHCAGHRCCGWEHKGWKRSSDAPQLLVLWLIRQLRGLILLRDAPLWVPLVLIWISINQCNSGSSQLCVYGQARALHNVTWKSHK